MIVWIWIISLVTALVLYMKQMYSKFRKAGVNHLPIVAPFGNMFKATIRLQHFTEMIDDIYNKFPNDRFVGQYEFNNPVVVIRDTELIKRIAIKDFDYFMDHRMMISKDTDPLFGRNLFSLKGLEWKDMRSTLSPAFTSSKIRLMVPFMLEVGEQMSLVMKQKILDSKDGYMDLDARDLTTRYANDVIATCAFGLKVNSHAEENNEFFLKSREATNFSFAQMLKFFGFAACPKLMNFFKVTLFNERIQNFYRGLVTGVMTNREENNIIRPDMIHLLMQAKKGSLVHEETPVVKDAGFAAVEESHIGQTKVQRVWTDDDLIAQAVLFFIAGFDTVATAMTFLLYELAVNPEVQDKLAEEIKSVNDKNGGNFGFDSIQQMPYLDMVVSELLRLWPPAVATDRVCCKDYNLGRPNKDATEDYILRKGEGLMFPAWGIHRNPEFFPNPLKFDPERFSEENRDKIQPFTYFPFGLGPRNCIASRFALCEVKVMVSQLLKEFEIIPSSKTQIPVKLTKSTFNLRMDGGHWLRFKIRK